LFPRAVIPLAQSFSRRSMNAWKTERAPHRGPYRGASGAIRSRPQKLAPGRTCWFRVNHPLGAPKTNSLSEIDLLYNPRKSEIPSAVRPRIGGLSGAIRSPRVDSSTEDRPPILPVPAKHSRDLTFAERPLYEMIAYR
jgi:hypothetical protein